MNSNSKENPETPKQRLSLWENWQLDELTLEEKTIQERPQNNDRVPTNKNKEELELTFARLTEEGKSIKQHKSWKKPTREEYLHLVIRRLGNFRKNIPRLLKERPTYY